MNNKVKGYILGAIAAATYGMNPLFALPLYQDGMNPDSVLLFRYLFAIPIVALMMWMRGRSFAIQKKEILPLFLMGLTFSLSSLTLFASYNHMDVGIASTILFVYPILVALIMSIFFKEKFTLSTGTCLALATLGIGMLYKTEDGGTLSTIGTLLVFASALSYAIYIVAVNKSATLRAIPTLKVIFYVLIFGSLLFISRLCIAGDFQMPTQWYLWGNLLALAVFPTAISLICTTRAIQLIGSTPTAILGALEPVTAVIIGVMAFGEKLTAQSSAGLLLIIVAVTIVIAGGKFSSALVGLKKMFPKILRKAKK